MRDGIPGQEHVLGEAAPQVIRVLAGRVAVAAGVWIRAPVGVLAVTVLAEATPVTAIAPDVVLDEGPVTFPEAVPLGKVWAGPDDGADVLVAHDDGRRKRRVRVHLHVGA